jgi:hypothetical protein
VAAVTLWRKPRPCGHPNNRRLWPPGRRPPQFGPNPASVTLSDCLTRSRGRAERGRGWHFAPSAQTGSIRRVSGRCGRYGRSHRLRPGAVRRWPAIAARIILSRGEEIAGEKKNLLGAVFAETFCSQPWVISWCFLSFYCMDEALILASGFKFSTTYCMCSEPLIILSPYRSSYF